MHMLKKSGKSIFTHFLKQQKLPPIPKRRDPTWVACSQEVAEKICFCMKFPFLVNFQQDGPAALASGDSLAVVHVVFGEDGTISRNRWPP